MGHQKSIPPVYYAPESGAHRLATLLCVGGAFLRQCLHVVRAANGSHGCFTHEWTQSKGHRTTYQMLPCVTYAML